MVGFKYPNGSRVVSALDSMMVGSVVLRDKQEDGFHYAVDWDCHRGSDESPTLEHELELFPYLISYTKASRSIKKKP